MENTTVLSLICAVVEETGVLNIYALGRWSIAYRAAHRFFASEPHTVMCIFHRMLMRRLSPRYMMEALAKWFVEMNYSMCSKTVDDFVVDPARLAFYVINNDDLQVNMHLVHTPGKNSWIQIFQLEVERLLDFVSVNDHFILHYVCLSCCRIHCYYEISNFTDRFVWRKYHNPIGSSPCCSNWKTLTSRCYLLTRMYDAELERDTGPPPGVVLFVEFNNDDNEATEHDVYRTPRMERCISPMTLLIKLPLTQKFHPIWHGDHLEMMRMESELELRRRIHAPHRSLPTSKRQRLRK